MPPAPRGMPQVEVTFDIDANGILNVSAKDMATGRQQAIRIQSSSGLTKADIDKMRKEAESHSEDDRKKRELIDERNKADSLIYQTEKTLKEHGAKVPESDRKKIEDAVAALNKVKGADDTEEIRRRAEELMNASQVIGKLLYEEAARQRGKDAGPQGPSEPGAGQQRSEPGAGRQSRQGGTGQSGDNVVDADFEVLDEDKDKDKK
jgi:molecular chaperone DnaK